MNDPRNTRTLIVAFVIAIMALVPMKIYSSGDDVISMSQKDVSVLGVTSVEAVVVPSVPLLEAPYDEIEAKGQTCVNQKEATDRIKELTSQLKLSQDKEMSQDLENQIKALKEITCQK